MTRPKITERARPGGAWPPPRVHDNPQPVVAAAMNRARSLVCMVREEPLGVGHSRVGRAAAGKAAALESEPHAGGTDVVKSSVDHAMGRLARRSTVTPEGCFLFTGPLSKRGYARISVVYRTMFVHRLAWLYATGQEVPEGMQLDHLCHSRAVAAGTCPGGPCIHRRCWNIEHLELVTPRENRARGVNENKTQCVNGHPYDEANTYVRPGTTYQDCRTCGRDRMRLRRAAS